LAGRSNLLKAIKILSTEAHGLTLLAFDILRQACKLAHEINLMDVA